MEIYSIALISYFGVSLIIFLISILIKCFVKRDILGNGVELGIVNSFLLSLVWPVTISVVSVGFIIDMIKVLGRL